VDVILPYFPIRSKLNVAASFVVNRLRPGVHVPIKSVSVPAPISVVLVFHVTLWPGSTGADTTKLSGRPPTCRSDAGEPSINRPAFSHFGPCCPHLTASVCPGTKIER
jgi:hypothetical protein